MGPGIRAEVSIESPESCQLSTVTADGATASSVSRSGTGDRVVEEFTSDAEIAAEEYEEMFSYDSRTVYRYSRDREQGCVCEVVENAGCPVRNVRVIDGVVTLSFFASDVEGLRAVVSDLKSSFDGVTIRRLTRSEHERSSAELVFVDRSELTDRQRQVLRTAHEMGYFAHPRTANAGEVAAELGIARATFREHLATAQATLLDCIIEN